MALSRPDKPSDLQTLENTASHFMASGHLDITMSARREGREQAVRSLLAAAIKAVFLMRGHHTSGFCCVGNKTTL